MTRHQRAQIEKFWRDWLRAIHHQIAAALADTIDVEPSSDEVTRQQVESLIALEQELPWA